METVQEHMLNASSPQIQHSDLAWKKEHLLEYPLLYASVQPS